jgi:predicted nucleic acid-binding protein
MRVVADALRARCLGGGLLGAFDEDHPLASRALDRLQRDEAVAPSLWWFEVRNVLIVSERRGRIDKSESRRFLRELSRLPIKLDHEPDEAALMDAARARRLSVYAAAYLELADRLSAPLATLDGSLARAAEAAQVSSI